LHATQLGATGGDGEAHPIGTFSTGVRVDWGLSQRPARVDCGLSYTTVQATITRSAIVACYFIIIPMHMMIREIIPGRK